MDRAVQDTPRNTALVADLETENLLLFIDDDLREAGSALSGVERYLIGVLGLLENPTARRREVCALLSEAEVLEQLDRLAENVESLRRRLAKLAAHLRR